MRLQELVEEIQQDLEEGKLNFIIYQEGRQWKYEKYDSYGDKINEEAEKRYFTIKYRIDDEAIIVNGKKDFISYDLKYIQKRIKDLIRG